MDIILVILIKYKDDLDTTQFQIQEQDQKTSSSQKLLRIHTPCEMS